MKTITYIVSILVLISLATTPVVNGAEPGDKPAANPSEIESVPAVPATPAAVDGIVYARKFTLEKGYRFGWCQEKPIVKSGYLLVLKVNPDLVYPRQCAEPVLYVGKQTAERINHGYPSGYVIAIVPGNPKLDQVPIWFGTPELPELVDTATAKAELGLAKAAGIKPFSKKELKAAHMQAREELKGSTIADVLRVAADLIRRYSPEEKNIADTCVPAQQVTETTRDQD